MRYYLIDKRFADSEESGGVFRGGLADIEPSHLREELIQVVLCRLLSEGRGPGLQGGDALAICGPLPSVKAFMIFKAGFQFGDALILLSVLLSEFGDLLLYRGEAVKYLAE